MEEIITRLAELGYFRYVPESQRDDVIKRVQTNYAKHNTLSASVDPELEDLYKDLIDICNDGTRRFYLADAEDVGEGDLGSTIKRIHGAGIFQIEELPVPIVEEHQGSQDTMVTLTVSDSRHTLWNGTRTADSFTRGVEIASAFCKAMNEYCLKHQKSCRFSLQYGGSNDQHVVILTDELFSYMNSLGLKKDWLPKVIP